MVLLLSALVFLVAFSHLSRMCGGGKPKLPWGLDQWIYALPYGLIPLFSSAPWFLAILGAFVAFATAFLGKRTGHGQYFDLASSTKVIKPEFFDFAMDPIFGDDPNEIRIGPGNYWRDLTGLALTGAVVPLGLSIFLLCTGHWVAALLVFLSGAAKAHAYVVGYSQTKFTPTVVGEYGTGYYGALGLIVAFLAIYG